MRRVNAHGEYLCGVGMLLWQSTRQRILSSIWSDITSRLNHNQCRQQQSYWARCTKSNGQYQRIQRLMTLEFYGHKTTESETIPNSCPFMSCSLITCRKSYKKYPQEKNLCHQINIFVTDLCYMSSKNSHEKKKKKGSVGKIVKKRFLRIFPAAMPVWFLP